MLSILLLVPLPATALPNGIQPTYSDSTVIAYASPETPESPRSLDSNEIYILTKESGMDVTAQNRGSTAYGIGQLLIDNRNYYSKVCDTTPDTTDYDAQICMFRAYVKDRYKTTEAAKAFKVANGYY